MNWSTSQVADVYRKRGVENPVQAAFGGDPKRSKYGAKKKEVDGIIFDSAREARVYIGLKLSQALGHITDLKLQPRFLLQEGFRGEDGKWVRKVEYVADFDYFDNSGMRVICDVKGMKTPVFRLKEKLFRAKYPDLDLQLWS